jgi:hypothetical protein
VLDGAHTSGAVAKMTPSCSFDFEIGLHTCGTADVLTKTHLSIGSKRHTYSQGTYSVELILIRRGGEAYRCWPVIVGQCACSTDRYAIGDS